MTTPDRTAPDRRRSVLGALVTFLLVFAATGLWAVATPPMSSPDEPSHAIKAVAVVRGELVGEIGPRPTTIADPGAFTTVRIPADYAQAQARACFAWQPETTGACQADLPAADPDGTAEARTAAGQYPPLYYALVGWPSLLLPADPGFVAMRLVSAAVSSAFVAAGVLALMRLPRRRLLAWGAVAALTPMTLFLAGSVNPNGLEISTAFAVWAIALALLTPGARGGRTSLWWQLGVSACALVSIRALSPLWLVVALGISACLADRGRLAAVVRERAAWITGGAVVVVTAVALAWTARYGTLLTGDDLWPQYRDTGVAIRDMIASGTPQYLQMIGNFGWLDAPSPFLTVALWTAAVGAVLALGLAVRGRPLARTALVVLVAGVAVGPMILQLPGAADAGLVWQGRYTLPIAIGVPVVAAWILSRYVEERAPDAGDLLGRTAAVVAWALAAGGSVAFYWAVRRYAVGSAGELVTLHPTWSSPLGYLPAVALYAAVVGAATFLLLRVTRVPVPAPAPDAPEPAEARA